MAQKDTPDIRVLVGVEGGASIAGESGQLISKVLQEIAKNISSNNSKIPKVTFAVDVSSTTRKIEEQLKTIARGIKVKPLDLNIRTNLSSIGNSTKGTGKGIWDGIFKQSIKDSTAKNIDLNSLNNYYKDLEKQGDAFHKKNITGIDLEIKAREMQAKAFSNQLKAQMQESEKFNKMRSSLMGDGNTTKEIERIRQAISKLGSDANKLVPDLNRVQEVYKKLSSYESQIAGKGGFASENEKTKIIKLREEYQRLIKEISKTVAIKMPRNQMAFTSAKNENDLKEFINTLERYEQVNNRLHNNQKIDNSYARLLTSSKEMLASGNYNDVAIKKLRAEFRGLGIDIRAAGLEGQTFGAKLGTQLQKLGIYFSAATIMMGFRRQIRQTISAAKELDKVVTDLSVATGMNRNETQDLLNTYVELGKELGATTGAVAKAANDWLRQGKSIATTNKLIKDSLMLSKIGKIDSSEATTALTTMSKAYKIADHDVTSLVDKLTAVDAVSATTAGGIAKSFQETAVSANLAGISIDRMAGYIATVSEVSGDAPESVGNFFKSFLSRMSNIKEGRMIDPDTSEDLSTVETVLKNIGIELRNDQNQFRNFQDVLDEIAIKWKELEASGDKVGQTKIASALGLTRQQEKAKILFEHYDEAIKYAEISANSLGTAEEKFNNAYLTSVEASMDKFAAQYEQMSNALWNSGLVKGTFDTGAGFLGALTWIIKSLGTIPTLATVAIGVVSALSNKGGLAKNPVAAQYICVESQRTYALYNLVVTLNELIFSKRLYGNTSKWFIAKAINSVDNNTDGKVLLMA